MAPVIRAIEEDPAFSFSLYPTTGGFTQVVIIHSKRVHRSAKIPAKRCQSAYEFMLHAISDGSLLYRGECF